MYWRQQFPGVSKLSSKEEGSGLSFAKPVLATILDNKNVASVDKGNEHDHVEASN